MSTITPPPTSGPMRPAGFDVERFVTQVIDTFQRTSNLPLASEARRALLEPAVEHRSQIESEVREFRVRPDEIADAVMTVLSNALDIARRGARREIDEEMIRAAMKLECRYFPWC